MRRCLLLCLLSCISLAQKGIGLRFLSKLLWYTPPKDITTIQISQGKRSIAGIALYGMLYQQNGGIQLSINFFHKEHPGGFNLPGVMQDWKKGNSTAWTSIEADFRFGPRFGYIYPQIGYQLGYWLKLEGMLIPDTQQRNQWYLHLPLGMLIDLPTQFGTVGFAIHYIIGLSNLIRRPPGFQGDFHGGRLRAWEFELRVLVGQP